MAEDRQETLYIQVRSLLERPRDIPPDWAEDTYRAGETLALGLDIALADAGVKRTQLIAQRVNRIAFAESWPPPGGWAAFVAAVAALGGDRFPHLLAAADPPWYYVPRDFATPLRVPEPQPQTHTGPPSDRVLTVGSVNALARELEALEPLLRAHHHDPDTWFPAPLLEATAVSLETGLVIVVQIE
jgi:hypothetical protein